jgi:hypothetical protein
MSKATVVLAAFAAAVFFFALAVFTVNLGDVLLVPAGLLSLAAGLLIERLP